MANINESRRNARRIFDMTQNATKSYDPAMIALAALLVKSSASVSCVDELDEIFRDVASPDFCDEKLRSYFSGASEVFKSSALKLAENCSEEELKDFILSRVWVEYRGKDAEECSTPDSIIKLALAILNIEEGDSVADLCCGIGSFLVEAAQQSCNAQFYGVEIRSDTACIAKASCALVGANAEIKTGNILDQMESKRFDKVFCNGPFAMRYSSMEDSAQHYGILKTAMGALGRSRTADWVFAALAYNVLKSGGRALVIMPAGSTFNKADKQAREYFVNSHMIQAAISLPNNLFPTTRIQTVAFVIGDNTGPIRMVDASKLAIPGRRWDSMGDGEVEEILRRLMEDGPDSRLVGEDEICSAEFSLFPPRYLEREIKLINPVCIGDVTLSIERGASYRANELDNMATTEDTGFSYLKLGDIVDGQINTDIAHLTHLDKKTEKQWLRNGDLILSKNGAPFKVAVAEVPEGQTILANGNLYILRLDLEKAAPYYVAAFLSSGDGKELIEREAVGTMVPNLPLGNLKRIRIPLPPLHEQKEIANAYQARLNEIQDLKVKLENARLAATKTYDESIGQQ